ncbi:MAG TPA: polysaccharide deacetylase family protein [Bryobacteraceae bacterium]|nr:polysaccharide deacetylase family protein [Bryobacteraceae bacterium]
MAWAVRGRSSSVFAPSLWRGKPGRKAIALTFDDGPSPNTPAILDILARYSVPATFFHVGENCLRLPDVARAVARAGHEIGNHSQTHPNFALTRPSFVAAEFARAQESISAVTGIRPALVRAPFGVRWFGFRAMQHNLNLTGVMWSIIGLDWKLSADAIVRRILSRACDGDIICLHDGRGTLKDPDVTPTIDTVRRIVPDLLGKGYHFETVTQLLCPLKPAPVNFGQTI